MNIGDRLRNRREEIGLTMEAVAAKLHVNRSTIMRYESGETKRIPLTTIERLAEILETSTEYLMGWTASKDAGREDEDESVKVLTRMMRGMSPDKKGILIKIAKAMSDIADEELRKP